jgi:hypothetical protein
MRRPRYILAIEILLIPAQPIGGWISAEAHVLAIRILLSPSQPIGVHLCEEVQVFPTVFQLVGGCRYEEAQVLPSGRLFPPISHKEVILQRRPGIGNWNLSFILVCLRRSRYWNPSFSISSNQRLSY